MFIAGGVIAAAVPVLALAGRLRPSLLPIVAGSGMLAAGAVAATATTPTSLGNGPFSAAAQACALVALAAALLPGRVGPARPARRRAGGEPATTRGANTGHDGQLVRSPFSMADEMACHFNTAAEPVNVHLEVRVPGHLDEQAFRMAAVAAITANHRASGRRAPGHLLRGRYLWEHPAGLDVDPVSFTTYADSADLAGQRIAFIGRSPSIDQSPPLALLVASGPDCDYVILNAHHATMDGLSCLELLCDIGRRYRAVPLAVTTAGDKWGREQGRTPQSNQPEAAVSPSKPGWRRRRHLFSWRPARIAGERGGGRGYGLHMLLITGIPVVRALPSGAKATLNDALVTALIAAVGRWNADHDQPVRLVRITVPFNTRMQTEPQAAGNHSRLVTIAAVPPAPGEDLGPLLLDVARQVRFARQQPGPQLGASFRAVAAIWCPSIVKCALVRAALRIAGPLVCDTVMMTNLGKVTDPPDFGLPGDKTMAVSGQAQMPRGVSVAAITVGDKLQVAFRFNRALLDEVAADRFAAAFNGALGEITHSNSPSPASE